MMKSTAGDLGGCVRGSIMQEKLAVLRGIRRITMEKQESIGRMICRFCRVFCRKYRKKQCSEQKYMISFQTDPPMVFFILYHGWDKIAIGFPPFLL